MLYLLIKKIYFYFYPYCQCCGSYVPGYSKYKFKEYTLCYRCFERQKIIYNDQMYKYLTSDEYLTNNIIIDYHRN